MGNNANEIQVGDLVKILALTGQHGRLGTVIEVFDDGGETPAPVTVRLTATLEVGVLPAELRVIERKGQPV